MRTLGGRARREAYHVFFDRMAHDKFGRYHRTGLTHSMDTVQSLILDGRVPVIQAGRQAGGVE